MTNNPFIEEGGGSRRRKVRLSAEIQRRADLPGLEDMHAVFVMPAQSWSERIRDHVVGHLLGSSVVALAAFAAGYLLGAR